MSKVDPTPNGSTSASSTPPDSDRAIVAGGGAGKAHHPALAKSSPVEMFLNVFSNVRLGITLLVILFIYCSIGSAGFWYPRGVNIFDFPEGYRQIHVRQLPGFEMTEFEWFHWWPFDLLIGLICLNIIVTTLRRIPFKVVNLGVWMIHTGIITLAIGSVWYFGTKIEGDSPIVRRELVFASADGTSIGSLPSLPGRSTSVEYGGETYDITVQRTFPERSLADGSTAYAADLLVRSSTRMFQRSIVDGHPELSVDRIYTNDPGSVEVWRPLEYQLRIQSGGEEVVVPAGAQNSARIGSGADLYYVSVMDLDTDWEILSGDDQGKRVCRVQVQISSTTDTFFRQLLVGFPQYTEDTLITDNPQQPMQRAIKALGKQLVDDRITITLDTLDSEPRPRMLPGFYASMEMMPQRFVYLSNDISKNWALYLRKKGEKAWTQRPIDGLPLYNDYISDIGSVYAPGDADTQLYTGLRASAEATEDNDPLPDIELEINNYLRYAMMSRTFEGGGDAFNPAIMLQVEMDLAADLRTEGGDNVKPYAAFDPQLRRQSVAQGFDVEFRWVHSEEQLARLATLHGPTLVVTGPGLPNPVLVPITAIANRYPMSPFIDIEGTDYGIRVKQFDAFDGRQLGLGEVGGVAVVEIRNGDALYQRAVYEASGFNQDFAIEERVTEKSTPIKTDGAIQVELAIPPPLLSIIGGPADDQLRLRIAAGSAAQAPVLFPMTVGETFDIGAELNWDKKFTAKVDRLERHAVVRGKPSIVAKSRRNPDRRIDFSMIKLALPGDEAGQWLPYQRQVPNGNEQVIFARSGKVTPTVFDTPEGEIEVVFSRTRMELPAPVVLDRFNLQTHEGGFTNATLSIRDYVSHVRFLSHAGDWTDPMVVKLNDPSQYAGLSYYQASWDPPETRQSLDEPLVNGLNFTVLGVGNRHGVGMQLIGCCIAVIGMMYAFYVKPIIKRRRQKKVYAQVAAESAANQAAARSRAGVKAETVEA